MLEEKEFRPVGKEEPEPRRGRCALDGLRNRQFLACGSAGELKRRGEVLVFPTSVFVESGKTSVAGDAERDSGRGAILFRGVRSSAIFEVGRRKRLALR